MGLFLVTGGAGFIGSAIARRLLSKGHKVIIIDNLSTGKIENIPKECQFIQGNTFDSAPLEKLADQKHKYDAILHIAGQSSGEVSFDDPVYDLQTNTQSTINLLNFAKKNNCSKFIYASSMSVYGEPPSPFVSESSPTIPKSFYAVGKLASENYMRIYSSLEKNVQYTALRLFNVYGIGQNLSNLRQGMASIYLAMAIKDHKIIVKGSKDRFRDFIYIDDVIDAIEKVLYCSENYNFEIFNVCTGNKQTVENVINKIKSELPFAVNVEYISGTPGDQHGIYGDNQKIKTKLGWSPNYTFDIGMKKMVQWALTEIGEKK
jgi:UDP-glucose 4-epimerase